MSDDTTYQPARDPVEVWLVRQWAGVLGFTVDVRENFFGVGGNSLDAARILTAILTEFGVQLPLNALSDHPTVARLATQLRDHARPYTEPLIAIQDGDGTRPPLFLIHPDAEQVSAYCRLAHDLGDEFTVYGRYTDTAPHACAEAVRAAHPTGPYLLGGIGAGAAIAYETATRLDPVHLVALIHPDLVAPDTAPDLDTVRDWQPTPYPGPVDLIGRPPTTALPATTVQRTHDGTVNALRKLIG